MKRWKGYLIGGGALFAAAAIGFGLPQLLLRWQDIRLEGKIESEESARVEIVEQPELTIVDKILLTVESDVNTMPLTKGKYFDEEEVPEQVKQEVTTLAEAGVLPEAAETVEHISVNPFFAMAVDGERSAIFWQAEAYGDDAELMVTLDDETGKILSLYCTVFLGELEEGGGWSKVQNIAQSEAGVQEEETAESEAGVQEMEIPSLNALAKSFGEYLGCTLSGLEDSESVMEVYDSEEYRREWERLMKEGYSKQEAETRAREMFGVPEEIRMWVRGEADYTDEEGNWISYTFEYNWESGFFSVFPL